MFFLDYVKFEVRKWVRDPFVMLLLVYPFVLGLAGRFLVPFAENQIGGNLSPYYPIITGTLVLFVSRLMGSVVAFSILDDRDDNVFSSIRVAPLNLEAYIGMKLALVYVLSVLGTLVVVWLTGLLDLSYGLIFLVALVLSFGAPITALLINLVASNKVEGFAAIKSFNLLVAFAVAGMFFSDKKEFLFAFEPGFWGAKALSTFVSPAAGQLSPAVYLGLGTIYCLGLTILTYRLFSKKIG